VIGGIVIIFGAFLSRSEAKAAKASSSASKPAEVEVHEPVLAETEVAETVRAGAVAAVATEAVNEVSEQSEEGATEAEVIAVEVEEVADLAEIPDTVGEKSKFKQPLTYIEGVGPAYAEKLNAAGIMNPRDLLEQGASRQGRLEIVEKTELSMKLISRWVNLVDLFRVPGIGAEYADLLERSGVDTVPELAGRNAKNLHEKMVKINEEKKLVREVAGLHQIEGWIAQAKELPRKITF
jgi:predicted flap endonuclease-1-like 5' DNA nuclease